MLSRGYCVNGGQRDGVGDEGDRTISNPTELFAISSLLLMSIQRNTVFDVSKRTRGSMYNKNISLRCLAEFMAAPKAVKGGRGI